MHLTRWLSLKETHDVLSPIVCAYFSHDNVMIERVLCKLAAQSFRCEFNINQAGRLLVALQEV